MADLLAKGAAWLAEQQARHAARLLRYIRGADSVELPATPGRTVFEQTDEYGGLVRTESQDWLVQPQRLMLGGQPVLPQAGDRIRVPADEQAFVYEVMAPGHEPPYRYCDAYRALLRIHSKHVATEAQQQGGGT